MDLDATQVIPLDDYDDDDTEEEEDGDENKEKNPVAYLKVFTQKGVKENLYPVFEGENVIGRQDNVNISIPIKALSKQHACIEVRGDLHLLYDMESRNKTRRNKLYLAPNIRFELKHADSLTFADVTCQYIVADSIKKHATNGSETGSETGSESMFYSLEDKDKQKREEDVEKVGSGMSSDLIESTQKYEEVGETFQFKTPKHAEATICYAEDSDEDRMKNSDNDPNSPEQKENISSTVIMESDADSDRDEDEAGQGSTAESRNTKQPDIVDYANAATQAYDAIPDSDSEEESEGMSIFCADTQVYGVAGDNPKKTRQAEDAIYCAATQAYGVGEDDDTDVSDEDENNGKTAPTLKLNLDEETDDEGPETNLTDEATLAYNLPHDKEEATTLAEAATQVYDATDVGIDSEPSTDCDENVYEAATQAYGLQDYDGGGSSTDDGGGGHDKADRDCDGDMEPTQAEELEQTQPLGGKPDADGDETIAAGEENGDDEKIQTSLSKSSKSRLRGKGKNIEYPAETLMLHDQTEATQEIEDDDPVEMKRQMDVDETGQDTQATGEEVATTSRGIIEHFKMEEEADLDTDEEQVTKRSRRKEHFELGDEADLDTDEEPIIKGKSGRKKQFELENESEEATQPTGEDVPVKRGVRKARKSCAEMDDENEQAMQSTEKQKLAKKRVKKGKKSYIEIEDEADQATQPTEDPEPLKRKGRRGRKAQAEETKPTTEVGKQGKRGGRRGRSAAVKDDTEEATQVIEKKDHVKRRERKGRIAVIEDDADQTTEEEGEEAGKLSIVIGKAMHVENYDQQKLKVQDEVDFETQTVEEEEEEVKPADEDQGGGRKAKIGIADEKNEETNDEESSIVKTMTKTDVEEIENVGRGQRQGRKRKGEIVEETTNKEQKRGFIKAPLGIEDQMQTTGDDNTDKTEKGKSSKAKNLVAGKTQSDETDAGPSQRSEIEDNGVTNLEIDTRRSKKHSTTGGRKNASAEEISEGKTQATKQPDVFLPPNDAEDILTACTQVYGADEDAAKSATDVFTDATQVYGKDAAGDTETDEYTSSTQVYGADGREAVERKDEFTDDTQVFGIEHDDTIPMVSDSEEEDVNSKRDRRRPVKIPSMLAKVPARSAMASPKTEGSPKKMQKVEFAVKSGSNVSSTSTQEVGTPQSSTTGRRGRKPKNQKKSTTQGTSRKTRGKIPQHTDEEENLTPELEENAEEPKQQVESAPVTRGKKSVTMATKDEEKKTSVARGKRKSVPGRAAAENIDSPEVVGGNRRGKRTLVAADEEVVFKVPAIKMTRTLTDDKTAKEPLHDEKKAVGRRSIRKSSEEEESMNDAGEPSTSTRRGRSRKSVAMATKDEDDVADSVRTIESVNKSVNKRAKRSSVRSRSETEEKPVEEEKTTMTVKTSRRTRNASNNSIKEDPESSMSKDCEIEKTKVAGRKGKQKAAKKTIQKTTVSDDEDLNNTSISSDSTDTSERDGRRGKRSRNTTPAPSTPSTGKNLKVTDRSDVSSPTLRRRSSLDTKPKVMFTGVVDKAGERTVVSLGGELVDSVYECTHLVTDKVRRTVKFLCGLSRGILIVNSQWLESSRQAHRFLDATSYIVKDNPAEQQYGFQLSESREKALNGGVLQGYKIHVTSKVAPGPQQMKDIIKCAAGEYLNTMPRKSDENTVVISCDADKTACQSAIKSGVLVVNAEFILTGLLKQELDLDTYRLFTNEGSSGIGKRKSSESAADSQSKRRKR